MALTDGQQLALSQLQAMAASGDAAELLAACEPPGADDDLPVALSLRCSGLEKREGGLALKARERFHVSIPADFPFGRPSVRVAHRRWAGTPHVHWGRWLCLYQAPATEWNPSDGMFGFIGRLKYWLERAALGELDPIGGPLHPPAVYGRNWSLPMFVLRVDAPAVGDRAWLGLAILTEISDRRADVVGWADILTGEEWPDQAAVAILLPSRSHGSIRPRSKTCSTSLRGRVSTVSFSCRCYGLDRSRPQKVGRSMLL